VSLDGVRVSRYWLDLREPADAAARSLELVEMLLAVLPWSERNLIHDLGCGSGAMGRWLAPLLPGPQHWVLHDRDDELLDRAAVDRPGRAADGAAVTAETQRSDITRLGRGELAGATLITASALLDMLTADELAALAAQCAGCPTLLSLSVDGRVEMTPPDPLDGRITRAFNDHQRRATEHGHLLGPDAVEHARATFAALGAEVIVRPSAWRLGATESALAREWLTGWVGAACEQQPGLAAAAEEYADGRRAQLDAGQLRITVGHADLLILPGGQPA
jgi:hypothetical protein